MTLKEPRAPKPTHFSQLFFHLHFRNNANFPVVKGESSPQVLRMRGSIINFFPIL